VTSSPLPDLYLMPDMHFPRPDDNIVSGKLVDAFIAVLATHFPSMKPDKLQNCAIVAAFLQSTKVFDRLFINKGDSLLVLGYLDTLIDCLERSLPIRNILTRTFVRLMSKHGFNPEYHTVTFSGDAGGSFAAVVKNKILFKDMIGWKHGQYTHTLQWFGICLLAEAPDLCPTHKFTMQPADLYAYMVTRRTKVVFPGELDKGKAKEFSIKSVWDFCVDCNRDAEGHENPLLNLYTFSYRSPSNVTDALLAGGSLCNTFMGLFMQRRAGKYEALKAGYAGSKNFQKLAKSLQEKKNRLMFNADQSTWIGKTTRGTMVQVWTDPGDEDLRNMLTPSMQGYQKKMVLQKKPPEHNQREHDEQSVQQQVTYQNKVKELIQLSSIRDLS